MSYEFETLQFHAGQERSGPAPAPGQLPSAKPPPACSKARPNAIRLSIGTEHIGDIITDLEKGFTAAARK